MDRVTQDLNAYLDKSEAEDENLERILNDDDFKKYLHKHCVKLIKDDPVKPEYIAYINKFANKMSLSIIELMEGDTDQFDSIAHLSAYDFAAIEMVKSTSIDVDYAKEWPL